MAQSQSVEKNRNADTVFAFGEYKGTFDPMDYMQVERYENAVAKMTERTQGAAKLPKESEKLREIALALCDVFDGVFGEGTADKMLGGTTNLSTIILAYEALVKYITARNSAEGKRFAAIAEKYAAQK